MKAILETVLQPILQSARFFVAVACALLIALNTLPAYAAGMAPKSSPTDGEAQLNKIIDQSEESLKDGLGSMKTVTERANQGLNEVQSDADFNKMKRPSNTNAKSVIDQVKDAAKKSSDS
jgi:uncharacterized damage-inducible protein DinB